MEKEIDLVKCLENNNNIKMNAQCVPLNTIALVGNDWQHWKPLNKFTKISHPVKISEQCNSMGAIIEAGSFKDPYFHGLSAINLRVLSLCFPRH